MKRRSLDFHSADEVITEINRLRESGYQQLGRWNLSQICEHLAGTIQDHPMVDDLSVEDWREFMWIHAAHHLGFLVPSSASHTAPPSD